jgi:hypothetical protein
MKYLKLPGLESGQWYDRDTILLEAAFQVLVDFIEKEKPEEHINWNAKEDDKHAWEEMQSLYKWWKEERPARVDPILDDNLESPPFEFETTEDGRSIWNPDKEKYAEFWKACEESSRLEVLWNEEDQKNLHRLIDIRRFMWT